jgi:diacylglycerol kinase (ATP)
MQETPHPISEFKSKAGLRRVIDASRYSFQGLRCAWRSEQAFRQEVMIVVPGVLLALLLPVSDLRKLALVAVLLLVCIVELLNSAIEAAIDRISLERHPLSRNAKDFGSAAVMLSMLVAALTWGVIVLPFLTR